MMGGAGMAGAVLGFIGDQYTNGENRRFATEQGKKQYQRQRALNQQGKDLALEMWNDTNYGAQMKHMMDAGINPNTIYGGSGAGGATASTGSGGSAPSVQSENKTAGLQAGIGAMSNLGMMKTQQELLQAQKDNVEANTNKTNIEASNIEEPIAVGLEKTGAEKTALELENEKNKDTLQEQKEKIVSEGVQERNKATVSTSTLDDQVQSIKTDNINKALQSEAIKAGTALDTEKTRAVAVELAQEWEELYQKARANDNQAGMVNIAGFKAKLDEILGKANLSIREKELMIRGAEAFLNGLGTVKGKTTTTNTHESTPKGEYYRSSKSTTR